MTNNIGTVLADKYNAIAGAVVAALSAVFGIYWYIFAAFFALNVIDWLTGWYKANKKREESSKVGFKGAVKKLGYWAIVLVAFIISDVFTKLGSDVLNMNLSFLFMIGWFTLATLLVNEARSILENLVECGYNVPAFLIKGLAVTQKMLGKRAEIPEADNEDTEKKVE